MAKLYGLTSGQLKRVGGAVRGHESQNRGYSKRQDKFLYPDAIAVKNIGVDTVPIHGILWIVDIDANGILQAQRPEHPYLKPIVISSQALATDEVGQARRSGIHLVECENWGALTAAMFPFQAICQVDSFQIRKHFGAGNFLVWKKSTVDPLVYAELLR